MSRDPPRHLGMQGVVWTGMCAGCMAGIWETWLGSGSMGGRACACVLAGGLLHAVHVSHPTMQYESHRKHRALIDRFRLQTKERVAHVVLQSLHMLERWCRTRLRSVRSPSELTES